jgi:hypothetical protein
VTKIFVYKNNLPPHIKVVHFISDSAGCFESQLHRVIQPAWKIWCGVIEKYFRLTPAGDGKSALDGMFGHLNTVLRRSVADGKLCCSLDTITEAVSASNGLASTQFAIFSPKRQRQLMGRINGLDIQSVILTTLDSDNQIMAYLHSGYGSGIKVNLAGDGELWWGEMKNGKKKERLQDVSFYKPGVSHIKKNSSCSDRWHLPSCLFVSSYFVGHPWHDGGQEMWTDLREIRADGKKQRFFDNQACQSGKWWRIDEGPSRKADEEVGRKGWKKATNSGSRSQGYAEVWALFARREAWADRLMLHGRFLAMRGWREHKLLGKHAFLGGENAKDRFLRETSKPGGLVSAGGRVDRSSSVLTGEVMESELCVGAEQQAICFWAFNWKECKQWNWKTKLQLKVLVKLYDKRPNKLWHLMREEMSRMWAQDGGLLFCSGCQNTTKELVTMDQITSWITVRTMKEKETRDPTELDVEEEVYLSALGFWATCKMGYRQFSCLLVVTGFIIF